MKPEQQLNRTQLCWMMKKDEAMLKYSFEASRIYRRFLRSTGYLRCWMRPWRTWRAGAVLLPFPMRRFGKTEPRAQYNTKDFAGKCLEHLREMQWLFLAPVLVHRRCRSSWWTTEAVTIPMQQWQSSATNLTWQIWPKNKEHKTNLVSADAQRRCLQAGLTLSHEDAPHTKTHTACCRQAGKLIPRPWHVESEYKDTAKRCLTFCKLSRM